MKPSEVFWIFDSGSVKFRCAVGLGQAWVGSSLGPRPLARLGLQGRLGLGNLPEPTLPAGQLGGQFVAPPVRPVPLILVPIRGLRPAQ